MDDGQALRSMVRDDAYRVERVLSDGAAGRTELVTLDGEGPLVRKRMPAELANATAWAACLDIDEPLLPRIESLYRMPDELVVVYDYVPGSSLGELVAQEGALDLQRCTAVLGDVCRAVGALHARGVVHRDITPPNVIVAPDGAHLVDLGIARRTQQDLQHDTTTLGTWGFAAPEQYGFAQTDARSDVYALGRLLGFMLTGVEPGTDDYDQALSNERKVPASVARVAQKAAAFEPSARYQSADELAQALRDAVGTVTEPLAGDDEGARGLSTPSDQRQQVDASLESGTGDDEGARGLSVPHDQRRQADSSYASQQASDDPGVAPSSQSAGVPQPEASPAVQTDASADAGWESSHATAAGRVTETSPVTSPDAVAAPPRRPRRFFDAPALLVIAVLLVWLVMLVFCAIVWAVTYSAIVHHDPPWGPAHYGMSVASTAGCGAMAYELYLFVTWRGAYAHADKPWRQLVRRVLQIAVVTFASMMLSAVLLPSPS